jgi:hypothetical protein
VKTKPKPRAAAQVMPLMGQVLLPHTWDRPRFGGAAELAREYLFYQAKDDHEREAIDAGLAEVNKQVRRSPTGRKRIEARRQEVCAEMHRRLQEMSQGKDARTVFAPDTPKQRGPQVAIRDQAIVMEVLRLSQFEEMDESEAIEAVCNAYSGAPDIRTIKNALKKWRDHPCFASDRVKVYADLLKHSGRLD